MARATSDGSAACGQRDDQRPQPIRHGVARSALDEQAHRLLLGDDSSALLTVAKMGPHRHRRPGGDLAVDERIKVAADVFTVHRCASIREGRRSTPHPQLQTPPASTSCAVLPRRDTRLNHILRRRRFYSREYNGRAAGLHSVRSRQRFPRKDPL